MDSICRRRFEENDENDSKERRNPLISIPDPLQRPSRSLYKVHGVANTGSLVCNLEENKENNEEIPMLWEKDKNGKFHELERKNTLLYEDFAKEIHNPDDQLKSQLSAQDWMDESEKEVSISNLSESLEKENQELRERLHQVAQEKDEEWEMAVTDLTSFLLEGCQSLEDTSSQIKKIINSFPNSNSCINDRIEQTMQAFIEKDRSMISLKKSLEDAQKLAADMTAKLDTLRGAMQIMTKAHELESDKMNSHDHERRSEEERSEKAETFFLKLEEANEMMKEADLVVKKLLLANENATLEADRWKEISEKLQMERDFLATELERTRDFFVTGVEQTGALISVLEILTIELQEKFEKSGSHLISEPQSRFLSSIEEIQECILDLKASINYLSNDSGNSSECVGKEQANHSTFPMAKKYSEDVEIRRDLKFSINGNLTCNFYDSAGEDRKDCDLAMKIAKVDAILCHTRGVEVAESSQMSGIKENNEVLKELGIVKAERDRLQEHVTRLNEKLDMARAVADEKELIATKARQEAEASRIYAEEKEEQARVLGRSIAELESTVAVLENKVCEMKDEDKDEEKNVRASVRHLPRQVDDIYLELYYSKKKIEELQKETAHQAKEIKRYEEHIAELMLHSEAQSSLYHQKFQILEAMMTEAKKNTQISGLESLPTNKSESVRVRARGSTSPFKCMSSLLQQINSEKEKQLSQAKIRIDELETLAITRHKQVCMLTAKLAAADNMTHDVIRDLLGVKLDLNNYADWLEMRNVNKLLEDDDEDKDEEIKKLKGKIHHLLEEKDRWMETMKVDIAASQVRLEKLQRQHQLMTAQNEMLKMDKRNLTWKLAEHDGIMKDRAAPKSFEELLRSPSTDEVTTSSKIKRDKWYDRITVLYFLSLFEAGAWPIKREKQ